MPRPARQPIGLHLAQVAKVVSRAFDNALAEAGGSLPVWLVLISLKSRPSASQRQLAEAAGIQGATLTHHKQLRSGLPDRGIGQLEDLLTQLRRNVT